MFTSLCAYVHCKSASVSISRYVFLFFYLNVHQFKCSLSLFVCLFGCYPAPVIIIAKCLCCYCKFDFVTQSSFSSIIIHHVLFRLFIRPLGQNPRHWVRAAWSTLTLRCMDNSFKVSTYYFVLFVLQKVTFSFCLCWRLTSSFILHQLFLIARGASDLGLTYRCHLGNIMPDSIFIDWRRQRIT